MTTWTDNYGNVREVGGRIVKAAPGFVVGTKMTQPRTASPTNTAALRPAGTTMTAQPTAGPAPVAPVTAATPPPSTPPNTGPLNYTGLSTYINDMAKLNLETGQQRETLNFNLAQNQQQAAQAKAAARKQAQLDLADAAARLNQGKKTTEHEYGRSVEAMVDQMNLGNLLFSGKRDKEQSHLDFAKSDALWQLEQSYGAPFRARVQAQLQALEAQYGSQFAAQTELALKHLAQNEAYAKSQIEQNARTEWNNVYGAPPIQTQPQAAPVAAAPAPAPTVTRTPYNPATHVGRVALTNGQYAPLVRTPSGGTAIDPTWQKWMAANGVTRK